MNIHLEACIILLASFCLSTAESGYVLQRRAYQKKNVKLMQAPTASRKYTPIYIDW